ncbi:hypothetical protein OIE67_02775 [Nonomuraea fuscirosea]|uniref:hypothetical protein n=1 Tax=Nonomuraea fuscirosea TaxID=1291556 RepID=UPI002DD8DE5F|nr:hypothetical protein [Nonomuraea fuscirosea]WSA53584.1 hypothetical protein OIE67_02775 [Nonomuraea fuscirosea]
MSPTNTHSYRYTQTTTPRPHLHDLNHLGRGQLTLDAHTATPLDAPMHVLAEGHRLRFLAAKEASNGVA